MYDVELKLSTHPSKFDGYQTKSGKNGTITLFISNIWKKSVDEDDFIDILTRVYLIERICIERAWNGAKIKNRCTPCKVYPIVKKMLNFTRF